MGQLFYYTDEKFLWCDLLLHSLLNMFFTVKANTDVCALCALLGWYMMVCTVQQLTIAIVGLC